MQAWAPAHSSRTEEGQAVKSLRTTVLSLGWVRGESRREREMMEVMAGWARSWVRISEPMKPVEPVRMTFIVGEF